MKDKDILIKKLEKMVKKKGHRIEHELLLSTLRKKKFKKPANWYPRLKGEELTEGFDY